MRRCQLPVHLENDASCVGLSELLAHGVKENAACVVIGTGWSHDCVASFTGVDVMVLGGELATLTTIEPASSITVTTSINRKRFAMRLKSGQSDWDGRKVACGGRKCLCQGSY